MEGEPALSAGSFIFSYAIPILLLSQIGARILVANDRIRLRIVVRPLDVVSPNIKAGAAVPSGG